MDLINKKKITITQKRIASPKLLQLICSILAFVLDIAVLVILIGNTTEPIYLLCPLLLAIFDAIFIFKVIYSNYRFSYALHGSIIHTAVILALSALTFVSASFIDTRTVFAGVMIYSLPATHAIQCFSVILNTVHSVNSKKIVMKIIAISASSIFAASALIYGSTLLSGGYFGQGSDSENRTVAYELDESGNGYTVTGLLRGFGKTAVIPASFNGLPVTGIDCRLFTDEKLETVVLECSPEVAFVNVSLLDHSNPNLTIETSKETLNAFRRAFYSLAFEYHNFLDIANSLIPNDMSENQVYVTFCYTYDLLEISDEILDAWFGAKGDKFSLKNHAGTITYIDHASTNDVNDMYWCYKNQKRMIFSAATTESGANVDGMTVNESQIATIFFDKIYRVVIEEDNDEKYTIDKTYTSITAGGEELDFKLATSKNVMAVIESVPGRDGFELDWRVGSDKHAIADINAELALIDGSGRDEINMHPVWSLLPPTITTATANQTSSSYRAVYGSNVELIGAADAPHPSISVKYEWKFTEKLSDTGYHKITNMHPENAGIYTLTATSYSDSSSLTGTATKTVNVSFQKKDLNIFWILPDEIYSGTSKSISVQHNALDVINDDEITTQLSIANSKSATVYFMRDADSYTITAYLTGDCGNKYVLTPDTRTQSFTVQPCEIPVIWNSNESFVYNGYDQHPSAEALGVGDDGYIALEFTTAKNAGEYSSVASTKDTNYILTNTESYFVIERKPITELYWDYSDLSYTGSAQCRRVSALEGAVENEESAILKSLIYLESATNAGNYTSKIALPDNSNYIISCSNEADYTIHPMYLEVYVPSTSITYDGAAHYDYGKFTTSGTAKTDKIDEILSLAYKGPAYGAVDAGAYHLDADAIPSEKFENYYVVIIAGKIVINPRTLTVKLDAQTKVYDGKVFSGEYTYTANGLADSDIIDEIVSIQVSGTALTAVNAGSYRIESAVTPLAKYNNYSITFSTGYLTITKAPLTLNLSSGNKVYDGSAFPQSAFTSEVNGFVNGETLADVGRIVYGGDALSSSAAGAHKLTGTLVFSGSKRNYEITETVGGDYSIEKKALKVTAVCGSKTYDGKLGGGFSISVSGLVGSDTVQKLGTPIFGGDAATNPNAGTHELTVTLPSNNVTNNYDITYESTSYTIHKKALTVTATAQDRAFAEGVKGGSFDFTVSGLASTDTKADLGTPEYSGTATDATAAGTYTLNVKLPKNSVTDNYNITYIPDKGFTISAK